ncbi:MAG TPA: metal ABC transporter permease [Solirubrobacteraceae bacterium]|jgi:zinc/manganese transport system permease protein|nr:metal ABC transporter permease [Solirubrobacteraceae bacterium]
MQPEAGAPHLGWNVVRDVEAVVEFHFMVNALVAAAIVAVAAAVAGWLMVLRRESFAGHTLSMMAFPGASAAALAGVASAWGYLGFCVAAALAIAAIGARPGSWREEPAGIGVIQAAALAAGFLFVSLYGGVLGDLDNLLFGNLLGISDGQVLLLAVVAVTVLAALAAIGRPLALASVDAELARTRGVPVTALSAAYLVVLALAVAVTSRITGPLLVFALLVVPAACAQTLTSRPALSLALSVAIGLAVAWVGLGISYFSSYPSGFFIATFAFAAYVLVRGSARVRVAVSARAHDAGRGAGGLAGDGASA